MRYSSRNPFFQVICNRRQVIASLCVRKHISLANGPWTSLLSLKSETLFAEIESRVQTTSNRTFLHWALSARSSKCQSFVCFYSNHSKNRRGLPAVVVLSRSFFAENMFFPCNLCLSGSFVVVFVVCCCCCCCCCCCFLCDFWADLEAFQSLRNEAAEKKWNDTCVA